MRDTPALRKARGAFFTPPEITGLIVDWAIRSGSDKVLEPACGEASFLLAARHRLRRLGATRLHLDGIELHEPSARTAAEVLGEDALGIAITVADFFDILPASDYDAVIGNPPYIRYHHYSGAARAKGLKAALAQGVRLTGLASAWAPFVVHAAQFLRPGGRLGLVLPAELLTVNYAAQVRRFLLHRFSSVRLVMFEELVFPGVLEEVVLLLAEGVGPAPRFEVYQARDARDLGHIDQSGWSRFTPDHDGKWTPALLPARAVETYRSLSTAEGFSSLATWGRTYLGAVTGNNKFFALNPSRASKLKIPKRDLLRISPPGSRHLRGFSFSERLWEALAAEDRACYLFYPRDDRLARASRTYVKYGEAMGVHQAYKCRNRTPWWRVPLVRRPDLLLTYMDYDRPRLVANDAQIHHLNSLYGVSLRRGVRRLGRELLPIGALNTVTLLAAEIVGRAYGGGLLKLEPREADVLPVPSNTVLTSVSKQLEVLGPQLSVMLREDDVTEVATAVDRVLLTQALGIENDALQILRNARSMLFSRRVARGRGRGPY